jgi:hypothetical protein
MQMQSLLTMSTMVEKSIQQVIGLVRRSRLAMWEFKFTKPDAAAARPVLLPGVNPAQQ